MSPLLPGSGGCCSLSRNTIFHPPPHFSRLRRPRRGPICSGRFSAVPAAASVLASAPHPIAVLCGGRQAQRPPPLPHPSTEMAVTRTRLQNTSTCWVLGRRAPPAGPSARLTGGFRDGVLSSSCGHVYQGHTLPPPPLLWCHLRGRENGLHREGGGTEGREEFLMTSPGACTRHPGAPPSGPSV